MLGLLHRRVFGLEFGQRFIGLLQFVLEFAPAVKKDGY
jgi:hypothetical protein